MIAKSIVSEILRSQAQMPAQTLGQAFAPANIALCKYWGKRDETLNLPLTNSLSISLGQYGALTKISEINQSQDSIWVNGEEWTHTDKQQQTSQEHNFCQRLVTFLDLFRRTPQTHFKIETELNIPIAAGLASSACGFAALVKALADLYHWNLETQSLSILARLGSGSACRSLWDGFVEWEKGEREDGLDSHGVLLSGSKLSKQSVQGLQKNPGIQENQGDQESQGKFWDLRIGLLILNKTEKPISSRLAMKRTKETSIFFSEWPKKVQADLIQLKTAIQTQDFTLLGTVAESNALAMHALMMTAEPPILYSKPETLECMQAVWQARAEGLDVYFTQDAGPNLKLLFLEEDSQALKERLKGLTIINPFAVNQPTTRVICEPL